MQLGGLKVQYMKTNQGQCIPHRMQTEDATHGDLDLEDGLVDFGGLPDEEESQWPDNRPDYGPHVTISTMALPLSKQASKGALALKPQRDVSVTMVSAFELAVNSELMVITMLFL